MARTFIRQLGKNTVTVQCYMLAVAFGRARLLADQSIDSPTARPSLGRYSVETFRQGYLSGPDVYLLAGLG
jgi:hypothetical protein